jgi:hypothetical protein
MGKLFDDNAVALICLTVLACWGLATGHPEIATAVGGGILGYMTKSAKGS